MVQSANSLHISPDDVFGAIVNLKHIVLEVTDKCNLACKYCIYGENYAGFDSRLSQNMSFSMAKTLIDYLADIWSKYPSRAQNPEVLVTFYGGEPLLNFRLIRQVVDYLDSLNINRVFKYSMTSNCLLLNRHMDYLVEKGFFLLCSLDGDKDSNGYRVFRDGSPSYDRVFANICSLKNKYPDYFKTNVAFNAVLHKLNSLSGVYSFFERTFNKTPELAEVSGTGFKNENDYSRFDCGNILDQVSGLAKEKPLDNPIEQATRHFIISHSGNFFVNYLELFNDSEETSFLTNTCTPFGNKMFVKVDGKLLPCEQIPHVFFFGQIKDRDVLLDYEQICTRFNSYLDQVEKKCRTCAKQQLCDLCFYKIDGMDKGQPRCKSFFPAKKGTASRKLFYDYISQHPSIYKKALEQ